jgi:hypothetical protein
MTERIQSRTEFLHRASSSPSTEGAKPTAPAFGHPSRGGGGRGFAASPKSFPAHPSYANMLGLSQAALSIGVLPEST